MSSETQFKSSEFVVYSQKDEFLENTLSEKKIISRVRDKNLTLSEIIYPLGNDVLLIFAALLTTIFLIPVSMPGFSTVFGGIIFFIGISNLLNKGLWVTNSIKIKIFPSETLRDALYKGLKWFYFLEKVSKPHRSSLLLSNKFACQINGFLILFGSILRMIPLGFMPFSNTLPALIILFLSTGIMQKDGIIVILGYFPFGGPLYLSDYFFYENS